MQRLILGFLISGLTLVSTAVAQFGASLPEDIEFFDSDSDSDLPELMPRFDPNNDPMAQDPVLSRIQFVFDELLDPRRLSLIESVSGRNLNDMRLNDAARSIIRNHLVAMQQVELAIQFLEANRDQVIAGEVQAFNDVFGQVNVPKTVAVLSPFPLSGTASLQMGANGLSLMFDAPAGGGGGGGGGVVTDQPNVSSQVAVGDILFIEDPAAVTVNTGVTTSSGVPGIVVRVLQVIGNDPASAAANGGGGGGNTMQELILDPQFGTAATTMTTFDMARVFKVIRFEEQIDATRYDRVLATFKGLRDSLSGLNPAITAGGSTQVALRTPLTYNRRFTDINTVWAPGVAEFTELNQSVSDFMTSRHPTGLVSTRGADRLVRQAGFSNSDSHLHIDRLEDQGNLQAVDFAGRDTFPLLWTEDNELPRNFSNNQFVPGSTDFDRSYFRDQQTLFGEPDNPWTQHLGRAFFEETQNHVSGFFDDTIVADGLQTGTKDAERPARSGNFQTQTVIDANGVARQVRVIDTSNVPESGDKNSQSLDMKRWQMIIKSYAEFSTDQTLFNNAAVGISRMFGGFAPGDFSAKDAGNYGRFAAMIGGNSLNGISANRIEPFGKRGKSGFNPVVSPF